MSTDEAIEATRKIHGRADATYDHMTTRENGHIYIKVRYIDWKYIGGGDFTYVWDSLTGKLVRWHGGK